MREILFRGKRKDNGKWVYGNYAVTDNNEKQHFIFQNKAFEFEVDPETVQDDLQTIKEALEKQIPKKPIEKEVIGVSMSGYKYKGQCPKCSLTVSQFLGNYCHHCGQALDWSEVKK